MLTPNLVRIVQILFLLYMDFFARLHILNKLH